MKGLVAVLTFAILFSLIGGQVVMAAKPAGQQGMLNDAIVRGADLHLSRQGTFGGIANTWEWVIGSRRTGLNVQGISATGLLAAFERTGDARYLAGAVNAGNTLLARYNAMPNTYAGRPYSQDVEFLVRLTADSGNPLYAARAAVYYSRLSNNETAVALADRYIAVRKSMVGWDLSSQIRAANVVGQTAYARAIVARLIERRVAWDHVPYGGWDYTPLSYPALLWALAALGAPEFDLFKAEMRDAVTGAQGPDGSWWEGDFQTTAYAILGLAADGTAKGVQAKGWAFLRDTQTAAGGWSYPPEYGEINSEVLMALGALNLTGVQAGKTDPQPGRGNDTGKHKLDPQL